MDNRLNRSLPAGNRGSLNNFILVALVWLLTFQSPLEQVNGLFKLTDELVAVAALPILVISSVKYGRLKIKHYLFRALLLLLIFVAVGLLGNFVYKYQPWKSVLTDLFTNLKFFLALMTGYTLAPRCANRSSVRSIATHLRIITVIIFILFCIEQITPVFGWTDVRYGLRCAKTIFYHSTYLAGAMAFLIVTMTVFYDQKNLPFIGMALIMLMFTLRSKAIVSALVYVLLFIFIILIKGKLKLWHIALLGVAGLAVAWQQISFYFIELSGGSARSIMTATSIQIMGDYFPIGTGFGTYGSNAAADNYSPVYVMYGFNNYYELASWNPMAFLCDTFWPIIFAQTGVIGSVAYVGLLVMLFVRIFCLKRINRHWFLAGLFIFIYLLISSTAEPAFNNSVAIPLAVVLGGLLYLVELHKHPNGCPTTRIEF